MSMSSLVVVQAAVRVSFRLNSRLILAHFALPLHPTDAVKPVRATRYAPRLVVLYLQACSARSASNHLILKWVPSAFSVLPVVCVTPATLYTILYSLVRCVPVAASVAVPSGAVSFFLSKLRLKP